MEFDAVMPSVGEECLQFAARIGIGPMVEKYPFESVAGGYERR